MGTFPANNLFVPPDPVSVALPHSASRSAELRFEIVVQADLGPEPKVSSAWMTRWLIVLHGSARGYFCLRRSGIMSLI